MTGFGKSYHCQAFLEANLDDYDRVLIFDSKDEYTGLVEAHDRVKRFILGPREQNYPPEFWKALIQGNEVIQFPKHDLLTDDWQDVVATIIHVARNQDETVLICLEEAHELAPEGEKYPKPIKLLATKGRGERVSSMWVTQRLQELDKAPVSQCTSRLLGGFEEENDLKKIRSRVSYPAGVHNPQNQAVTNLPSELKHDEDGPVPVRKFTDESGDVVGSEWIFSDDTGDRERRDTRGLQMKAPHHSPQGKSIRDPRYG